MNFKLKDKPLAFQIWIILCLVLGLAFILVSILFPLIIKKAFTNETYARIIDSQDYFLEYKAIDDLDNFRNNKKHSLYTQEVKKPPPFRVVRHILLDAEGNISGHLNKEIMSPIIEEFKKNAGKQIEDIKKYIMTVDKKEIIYVIRKVEINRQKSYLISYLWGAYRGNLVKKTLGQLIGILLFVLIISWIASMYISRYLTKPLQKLQKKVKKIAQREWDTPVSLERGDEIGKLGKAVDWMRKQLVEQNEKQQSFLQQVSHELKTPVMVIRSYAQSIYDGIYPKGDLESSIKVIEEETHYLEKRVGSLLNLTKYDYLSTHKLEKTKFNLTELIKEKVDKFSWRCPELQWKLDLDLINIKADRDKIIAALENILDNQIRYADNVVGIKLSRKEEKDFSKVVIRFYNDGPAVETENMENIFKKYQKGNRGNYGLGLAIVKKIVDMHEGKIWVENRNNGVAFYIELIQKVVQ